MGILMSRRSLIRRVGTRRNTAVAAACVVMLTAAWGADVGGAGASEPALHEALSPDAHHLAAELGIDPGDAAQRLRLQRASGSLSETAGRQWPVSFGGLWIDHRAGGTVS